MFLNLKPVSVVTILGTLKGETAFTTTAVIVWAISFESSYKYICSITEIHQIRRSDSRDL